VKQESNVPSAGKRLSGQTTQMRGINMQYEPIG
jgi:hypothetical protein